MNVWFIQGRFTELDNIPSLLMLIDFEKAFDFISWSFVRKVLQMFGFGKLKLD